MQYRSFKEIHALLHSAEIGQFQVLEYRLLLIEICYLINQHMAQGQSLNVTRVLAREYNRLAQAYQEISQSFDPVAISEVKFTAISAIETVQLIIKQHRTSRLNSVESVYSAH